MSPEFRQGEKVTDIKLTCTECEGPAEGNHSWTDGSGEICDKCAEEDEKVSLDTPGAIPALEHALAPYEVPGWEAYKPSSCSAAKEQQNYFEGFCLEWDEG